MTDSHDNDRSTGFPWITVMMLLPILYVLSPGPLWWMQVHGMITEDTSILLGKTIYFPLAFAVDSSETVHDVFVYYISLFAPVG